MVSDIVIVAAIGAIPATIAAIVSLINKSKIVEVGYRVDGRLDELLDLTRRGSFAEGVKHETDKITKGLVKDND